MISMSEFQRVRKLSTAGENKSSIAREVGLDRKTVAKYLRCNSPPKYRERVRPTREDEFAPFEKTVRSHLVRAPDLTAAELYALIRAEGYKGSERTVQRRMRKQKASEPKERFFEQEYEPGEQAQFDFKESIVLPFVDGPRVLNIHFGTLPHSDVCRMKIFTLKTFECFIDGIHSFFESVGGMTKNIRIDNLSPCVRKVSRGRQRDYTRAFERAIEYYGFGVLPCSPGRGNEKGDVERDIQTHTRRFVNHVKVHGIVFDGVDDANAELARFMEKAVPLSGNEKFAIEQKALTTLPDRDDEVLCKIEELTGGQHGTVRFCKATYSIPDTLIGSRCRCVGSGETVRIYRADEPKICIIEHQRQREHCKSIKLEHVLRSLLRKPQAMVRWAHRDLLFPTPAMKQFYERLKQIDSLSAEREFLKTINLVQHVPMSEITCAVEIVLRHGRVGFESVRDLLMTERRPENVVDIASHFNQQKLNPDLQQYDQLIPKGG